MGFWIISGWREEPWKIGPLSAGVSERSLWFPIRSDWDRSGGREAAKGAVTKVWVEVMEPEQLQAVEDNIGSQSDWSPPARGSSLLLG